MGDLWRDKKVRIPDYLREVINSPLLCSSFLPSFLSFFLSFFLSSFLSFLPLCSLVFSSFFLLCLFLPGLLTSASLQSV